VAYGVTGRVNLAKRIGGDYQGRNQRNKKGQEYFFMQSACYASAEQQAGLFIDFW
jgi:hypothetical protein